MAANVEAMVRAAMQAFSSGNKVEARELLERAVEIDEQNEKAWLWLSAVVDSPEEQRICLENVLVINPNNERAKMGLRSLGVDPNNMAASQPPPAGGAPAGGGQNVFTDTSFVSDEDPFADVDFGTPTSGGFGGNQPASKPPAGGDEWSGIATSSASSYGGPEPTGQDYDAWMNSLGLGSSENQPQQPNAGATRDDPFADASFGYDQPQQSYTQADFDDPFADASFGDSGYDAQAIPDIDEAAYDSYGAAPVDYNEADAYDYDMEAIDYEQAGALDYDEAIDGDPFGDADDLSFAEFEDGDLAQDPLFGGSGDDSSDFGEFDETNETDDDLDIPAMFEPIPDHIKATRLPGQVERPATLLVVGVGLLVILNLGAIFMLFTRIAG